MTLFVIFALVLAIFIVVKLTLRPTNFPPGPRGWPVIGYASSISKTMPIFEQMQNLAKTYGPVTGFYMGLTQPFISVVGYDAVKEALLNDDLNSRPSGAVLRSRSLGEKLGLIFSDGSMWQDQRRFTLRHLRDLGFGKTSIESQMLDEIQELVNEIKELAKSDPNHVVEFKGMFSLSVINILWAIIGGKRFQRDDDEFRKLLDCIDKFLKGSNAVRANIPVPAVLVRLFPSIPKLLGLDTSLFHPIQKFVMETIDGHLSTRSEGDAPRDFLDVYLNEMDAKKSKSESHFFTKNQLMITIQDLFAAGADTSSNAIGFGILYMIHYQDVQRRMQEELDEVCGDAPPSLAHRSNLPYTDAVLMELLRIKAIAPMAVPHFASRDTQVKGFNIPKGSVVMVNLESVCKDETIWKDPEQFRPERHLNEEGKLIKNEALIPFGIGKRACLGEPLARNTFFLFMAGLVKTFDFQPVADEPLPTLEPIAGIVLGPRPFKSVVSVRH